MSADSFVRCINSMTADLLIRRSKTEADRPPQRLSCSQRCIYDSAYLQSVQKRGDANSTWKREEQHGKKQSVPRCYSYNADPKSVKNKKRKKKVRSRKDALWAHLNKTDKTFGWKRHNDKKGSVASWKWQPSFLREIEFVSSKVQSKSRTVIIRRVYRFEFLLPGSESCVSLISVRNLWEMGMV